ncbi:11702_t:CDS:2, partial [Funneliformis mosseae]
NISSNLKWRTTREAYSAIILVGGLSDQTSYRYLLPPSVCRYKCLRFLTKFNVLLKESYVYVFEEVIFSKDPMTPTLAS